MNIFVLHEDPYVAASWAIAKHVVKMPLESAQMLCTAHRVLDGEEYTELSPGGRNMKRWRLPDDRDEVLYKAAYVNHPCSVWMRESSGNYEWAIDHWCGQLDEYTRRYGKEHKSGQMLPWLAKVPNNIAQSAMTPFAQAMPDKYKNECAVKAYRDYYLGDKAHLFEKGYHPPWIME